MIKIERSQKDPAKKPWWWISGDTRPHKDLLKTQGARWSRRRKQWYLIANDLPEAIRALADEMPSTLPEEAPHDRLVLAIDTYGSQRITDDESSEIISAYKMSYTSAAPDILLMLYGKQAREVKRKRASYRYIQISGETDIRRGYFYLSLTAEQLKQVEALSKLSHRAGAYLYRDGAWQELPSQTRPDYKIATSRSAPDIKPGSTIPAPAQIEDKTNCPTEEIAVVDNNKPPVKADQDAEEEVSPIRIIAAPQDDRLKEDLRNLKLSPPAPLKQSSRDIQQIPQSYCGELSGSITGQVWCYGWCVHEGILIYLNMAGPKIATEAIRAKLAQGSIVNLLPEDAPAMELTAGEGNTGMYQDFLQYIPSAQFASRILIHESLMTANYGGKSTTFIIHVSEQQAKARLKQHVSELVNIAVFDDWSEYLWQAGRHSKLIRETRSGGGITIFAVDLDIDSWTRLLSGGLSENIIQLPQSISI